MLVRRVLTGDTGIAARGQLRDKTRAGDRAGQDAAAPRREVVASRSGFVPRSGTKSVTPQSGITREFQVL